MKRYRLTPAAQRDLSSIWDFTQENWGQNQAETYISEIRAAVERIAADPDRGRACDDIREGYRRYSIGSHLIFYIEGGDAVEGGSVEGTVSVDVIRILHQRMDVTRHL
ncbi:MAG: type II toxin-antitoxin system RelE/ParE family toxin [Microthrixaceae bacterium]